MDLSFEISDIRRYLIARRYTIRKITVTNRAMEIVTMEIAYKAETTPILDFDICNIIEMTKVFNRIMTSNLLRIADKTVHIDGNYL